MKSGFALLQNPFHLLEEAVSVRSGMGCEGDFNLDNDAAGDLLYEIGFELFDRVIELLQDPHGHEYDEEIISELFVRIEMIFALDEKDMISHGPDAGTVRELIGPYMEKWTKYHESAGHKMPSKRTETMSQTFDRLIGLLEEIG